MNRITIAKLAVLAAMIVFTTWARADDELVRIDQMEAALDELDAVLADCSEICELRGLRHERERLVEARENIDKEFRVALLATRIKRERLAALQADSYCGEAMKTPGSLYYKGRNKHHCERLEFDMKAISASLAASKRRRGIVTASEVVIPPKEDQ